MKIFNFENTVNFNQEEHPSLVTCIICNKQTTNLIKHMKLHDITRKKVSCEICNKTFLHQRNYNYHYKGTHLPSPSLSSPQFFKEIELLFGDNETIQSFKKKFIDDIYLLP